jgi:hypothetical protein
MSNSLQPKSFSDSSKSNFSYSNISIADLQKTEIFLLELIKEQNVRMMHIEDKIQQYDQRLKQFRNDV